MHEYTQKYMAKTKGPSDRSFGLVFAIVFLFIGLYPLSGGEQLRIWAILLAGSFGLLALIAPYLLSSANRLWMKLGELLHRLISPVALGIVFYMVVTPIGLIRRLLSKDSFGLHFDSRAKSYWIIRDPPGPTGDSFNNQF